MTDINEIVTTKKTGWVVICDTLCQGPVIIYTVTEEDSPTEPEFFETEEAAWKEIVSDHIEQLQQFVDGEREFDETDLTPEDYPMYAEWYEDNTIIAYDEQGNPTVETSIEEINNR